MRGAIGSQQESSDSAADSLRWTSILDHMPVGIGVFDRAGALFHSNHHFGRLTRGSVKSIDCMSRRAWTGYDRSGEVLDPESHPGKRALAGQTITPPVNFRLATDHPLGAWIAVSALPLLAGEAITGAIVVVEEISELDQHAARLPSMQTLFELFAQHSSSGLWIAQAASGRFEYLNPIAEREWAVRAGGAPATLSDWAARLHPDDRSQVATWRATVVAGEPQRLSYRLVEHGATSHYIETSFPIPAGSGRPALVAGIVEKIVSDLPIYSADLGEACDGQLAAILRTERNLHKRFATLDELLFAADALRPGCIFIGQRSASAGGYAAVRRLHGAAPQSPIVLLAPAPIEQDAVIGALKAGAVDCLTAPLRGEDVVRAIFAARTQTGSASHQAAVAPAAPDQRLTDLPKRAREVLSGLLEGGTNKTIGRTLGISPRTVEAHRAHLMERLNVRSLPELLRTALQAGLGGDRSRRD